MFHIRKKLARRGGNNFYRDYSERKVATLCGADVTDRDVTNTKSGLAWLREQNGCAECAKMSQHAK